MDFFKIDEKTVINLSAVASIIFGARDKEEKLRVSGTGGSIPVGTGKETTAKIKMVTGEKLFAFW